MIGQTLSHFKITAKLGEGGMGEVYRAEDTKLGREVAIKVLPAGFTEDPERFARFEREAKVLAALNHSNIAAIYDLVEEAGTHFLVLELVEGEDLGALLARGALELEDALPLALQIAQALEVAHDKGIVHRDLKPANIMVSPDGQAKVLDFGLAKAFADDPAAGSSSRLSLSPTMTAQATQAGVILGTAAYMSPEQARGKPVDKRTDIWAFGVVLSEMLSGRRLFEGETLSDTLAAVLREPIETLELPEDAGGGIRYLLGRCLVRDPALRLRDIGEARILLSAGGAPGAAARRAPEPKRSRALAVAPWGVAIAAIIGTLFAWSARGPDTGAPHQSLRFTIDARSVGGASVRVSPDGRRLAFRQSNANFRGSLWVRPLDGFESIEIPETTNVRNYFWSADGRELAFTQGQELFAHDISAATTRQVLRGEGVFRSGSWSADGVILIGIAGSIYRAPASGGAPEILLAPVEGQTSWHAGPAFLPDGDRFFFTSEIEERGNTIPVVQVAKLSAPSAARVLIKNAMSARWSDGHIVYATGDGVLTAQRADQDSLDLLGAPFEIGRGMLADSRTGFVAADASANGVVAYRTFRYPEAELVWYSPTGKRLSSASKPGTWHNFDISPDGKQIATTARVVGRGNELWIIEPGRRIASRVDEPDSLGVSDPTWSPDGRRLAFRLDQRLVTRAARGGEVRTVLDKRAYPDSWSRDGKWLVYGNASLGRYDLFAIALDETDARPIRLVEGAPLADEPRLSPNGRWVAFHASATPSEAEVFVIPFPPTGERWQLSGGGGVQPRWSPDGNTLFYLEPGGRLMRVGVRQSDPRNAGAPETIFDTGLAASSSYDDYTVAPDGRFLLRIPVAGAQAGAEAPIRVLMGWEEPTEGN